MLYGHWRDALKRKIHALHLHALDIAWLMNVMYAFVSGDSGGVRFLWEILWKMEHNDYDNNDEYDEFHRLGLQARVLRPQNSHCVYLGFSCAGTQVPALHNHISCRLSSLTQCLPIVLPKNIIITHFSYPQSMIPLSVSVVNNNNLPFVHTPNACAHICQSRRSVAWEFPRDIWKKDGRQSRASEEM